MSEQDLTTPAQYPTATRIENGTAYDVSGKTLGPVKEDDERPQQDPFASLGATNAPAPKQASKDPFADLGATNAPAPKQNDSLQPGETPGASQATGIGRRDAGFFERVGNALLPGFGPNTAATALVAPEKVMTPLEQERHPIATGIGEFAGSLTTPENIAIMAATSGLGTLAGPEAKLAAKVIPRLISAGFSVQQIVGAAKETPAFWEAIKNGNESEAERIATHIVLGTAGAVLAGQHAAGFEAKPSTTVGKLADKAVDRGTQRTVDAFRSDASNLTAASKRLESAKTVHDVRVQESDVATSQVTQAEQKLNIAKQNLEDQTGTQKEVDDAQSNLSAAAANANKARTALEDSHDTHATARADVDRVNRNIAKSNAKLDVKRNKEVHGTYEDLNKVAPSTPKGPAHYDEKEAQIIRGYLEDQHETVQPIRSKQDMYDALDHSVTSIENRVKPYVEKYANEENPSNVLMDVRDGLADSPQADFAQRGMDHLLKLYPQLEEPLSIKQSEEIRADLNVLNRNDLNNKWGRSLSDALKGDPEFAARYHAAESLRNGEYGLFEDKGVSGIQEARRDEAALIKGRNAVERGLGRGGSFVRGSGESGPLRRAAAKGAPYVGGGVGYAVGGAVGSTIGMPHIGADVGGAAGIYAGRKLGARINPGDLTQDAIVERMMKVKGAGVPTTEITGPGQPSTAGTRPMSMSPREMQGMMREYGPLHAELATHYGDGVHESSYVDLEKRFMEDIQDKKLHGVALEGPEKKLLNQINQQNASDTLTARKAAQEQEAAGRTIGKHTLPEKVEPVLRAPESRLPNGMNTQEAIGHDMAHVIVGDELGISFPDGIRSHLHAENKGTGRLMTAPIDWADYVDEEGNIDPQKLAKNITDFATTYVAGGVYNDLYHEVPFTENHSLGADMSDLKRYMKAVGFSEFEASKMIAQAAEDAATILSRPGMRDIIEGHASLREAGLNEKYHISPDRMEQILQDVKEGTKRETTNRKSSGNSGERNKATSEPGTGRKGKDEVGNAEGVSKESKGSSEGKEGRPSKQPESPTTATGTGSGAAKPNNPAFSEPEIELIDHEIGQGGHAGGGVASVEELNRPGHFVKIGRSGGATFQGKTPDFNLGAGEAGYRVENGKAPQLWAGQETPTTKAGVERHVKEAFGNKPGNPAFSADDYNNFIDKYHETMDGAMKYPEKAGELMDKLYDSTLGNPKLQDMADKLYDKVFGQRELDVNNPLGKRIKPGNPAFSGQPGMPPERSTNVPEYDEAIKAGGAIPGGIQKGDPEIDLPDLALFHDPMSGSTLALPSEKLSKEAVTRELHKSRVAYAPGNALKSLKETGGFTFNPKTGAVPDKGYQAELFPERRTQLDHPPTADDIREFMGKNKDVFDKHPELHVGGYGNELNVSGRFGDRDAAINSAKKLDQVSIWDNEKKEEIPTGGKSGLGPFNDYSEQQRLQDLSGKAPEQSLEQSLVAKYGDQGKPGESSWIGSSGKRIPIGGADHEDVVNSVRPGVEDPRTHGIEQGMVRERYRTTRGGPEVAFSVSPKGVTPEQIEAMKQGAAQVGRNGSLVIERSDVSPETKDQFAKHIDFPNGRSVEDALNQIYGKQEEPEAVGAGVKPGNPAFSAARIAPNWVDNFNRVVKAVDQGQKGQIPVDADKLPTREEMPTVGKNVYDALAKNFIEDHARRGIDVTPPEVEKVGLGHWSRAMMHLFPGVSLPEFGDLYNKVALYGPKAAQDVIDVTPTKPQNPAFAAAASTVPLMDNPLKIKGTGDFGKVNTIDVAKALNNFTKKQVPALKLDKAEPAEMVARAKDIMEDEAKYQMAQNNSGKAWYTTDIGVHDDVLKQLRPELADPAKLSMFKMAEAVLSSGQKPYGNFKSAIRAWDDYQKTGKFPPVQPDSGKSWGPRNAAAYGSAINSINKLIAEKGEAGASQWLLSEHPLKELRQYMDPTQTPVRGKADDPTLGAMILGPKRGPFAQNLHGIESAFTADLWVSRTWNRWMGTTEFEDPNSNETGIKTDRPRNGQERQLMKQSFEETAQKLDLTTSALQAVLWYYEQGLYDVHGSAKESFSFADAARRVQKEQAAKSMEQPHIEPKPGAHVHAFDFINALKGAKRAE